MNHRMRQLSGGFIGRFDVSIIDRQNRSPDTAESYLATADSRCSYVQGRARKGIYRWTSPAHIEQVV